VLRRTVDEYQSIDVSLSSDEARLLGEVGGGRVHVGLGSREGQWTISATSYVGTVTTPAIELLVRPKASIHNVFQMLDVAPDALDRPGFGFESERNLLAIVAELFSRSVERTIGSGLIRSYRHTEERLMALRGRIDLAAAIRHPGTPIPVPCRFDEYTSDILENRALKAALRRLVLLPGVRTPTRRALAQALGRFEEVDDTSTDVAAIERVTYTRLNRHYREPLALAALILRNLTFVDRLGRNDASAFLVNMNDLFQDWVADRLRRHLRGRLAVVAEPIVRLGRERQVLMQPDLVFYVEDQERYVADVKYKLTGTGIGRSPDYYQLLAYTTAMDLDEGLLIYCQDAGEAPDREVLARNTTKRLRTHAIDLHGSPTDLENAVARLAELVWQRSQVRPV
jgi:5-methylcytosine-specific restriction enzyme subunit McrC